TKAWVVAQFGHGEGVDEALVGLLLARRQRDLAVRSAKHAVGRDDRMVVAGAPRLLAGRQMVRREKREEADEPVVEARPDALAGAGPAALDQRRADPDR